MKLVRYIIYSIIIFGFLWFNTGAWAGACKHEIFEDVYPYYKCKQCGEWFGSEYVKDLANKKHIEDTLSKIEKSIDQIYSMICDLEQKFMGNDRMEQITNPDHIPETVRQEMYQKKVKENTKWQRYDPDTGLPNVTSNSAILKERGFFK